MASTGDYIRMHFIVFLWGFTAILGKLITIPPVEMVFYRTLLAAGGMAVVMLFVKGRFRVSFPDGIRLILIGFIVAIHWITFFGSARLANVSVSLVGFATASLWTALLEPLSNKKKINTIEVILGLLVIVGIVTIFSFDFRYKLGFVVGIISGFMASTFSVLNAKLIRRIDANTITLYEMTGAAIGILLFLPFYKTYWASDHTLQLHATAMDWVYMSILAFVCTVYAYTAAVELMKRVSVFFIQLTINMEPLYGMIMAIMVFGETEKMSLKFYIGAIIILMTVISYPFLRRKFEHQFR